MKRRKRRKRKKKPRLYDRFKFKVDLPSVAKIETIGNIHDLKDIEKIDKIIEKFHGDRRKKGDT